MSALVVGWDRDIDELGWGVGVAKGDDGNVDVGCFFDGLGIGARVGDHDQAGFFERAGVEEAGPGAVDRGFTDNADWAGEAVGQVPGIEGAPAPDANWTEPATGGEWAAEAAPQQAAASGW